MSAEGSASRDSAAPIATPARSGRLFRKYVLLFAGMVLLALLSSAAIQYQFLVRDFTGFTIRLQREQAQAAADKIDDFIGDIERQIAWTTQLPWAAATIDEWRLDVARLLQQAPAITEYRRLDSRGVEQLRVSRLAPDRIAGGGDFSQDPAFTQAMANGVYHGPVDFRRGSEPYMTLALRGSGNDVGIAEINLKFIWDVVSKIKVGEQGKAYVVSNDGRLIAHPNLNLVLRNTDASRLSQVRAARADGPAGAPELETAVRDIGGREVLAASARIPTLDWLVLTELPVEEAFAPLDAAVRRTELIILGAIAAAIAAAFLLARAMAGPIETLRIGAMRIGAGDFGHRIAIKTRDEVEALADQFNLMAARLQESHATLQERVKQRTAELTAANRRLAAAGERLRRVNAFKNEMLGIVAHDLKNPISVVMTRADLLAKVDDASPPQDQIGPHVAAIKEAGGHLVGMIDALLADAMAEAHEVTLRRASINIPALINDVAESNRPLAERKKQALTIAAPASLTLTGDSDRLREAIDNLVNNAIKYTQPGGRIDLSVSAGADRALIIVTDNGPGLTDADMTRLFGRFQRLSAKPTGGEPSTGLGLSIVKRIVELHGGKVSARSTGVGQGSSFEIALPVPKSPASPEDKRAEKDGTVSGSEMTQVAAGSILLVDDNKDVRESLDALLQSEGMHAVAAGSADEALTVVATGGLRPSLILSDFNLGDETNGIENIEALRTALGWRVPAIVLTGSRSPEAEAFAKHDVNVVRKPWNGDELIRLVKQLQKRDDERRETNSR